MPHRGGGEDGVGVAQELPRFHLDLVHEPAAEHRPAHQPAERGEPRGAVVVEQVPLFDQQRGSRAVVFGELREGELNADEPAARVALFVEPVGEDEPRGVVVGVRADALEERFGFGLHAPIVARAGRRYGRTGGSSRAPRSPSAGIGGGSSSVPGGSAGGTPGGGGGGSGNSGCRPPPSGCGYGSTLPPCGGSGGRTVMSRSGLERAAVGGDEAHRDPHAVGAWQRLPRHRDEVAGADEAALPRRAELVGRDVPRADGVLQPGRGDLPRGDERAGRHLHRGAVAVARDDDDEQPLVAGRAVLVHPAGAAGDGDFLDLDEHPAARLRAGRGRELLRGFVSADEVARLVERGAGVGQLALAGAEFGLDQLVLLVGAAAAEERAVGREQ